MHDPPLWIRAGWLVDGTGGPVQKDVLLRIQYDRLKAVDPAVHPADSGQPPPGDILDLSHCTILPGLVDAHVHLALSGTTDPEARRLQLEAPYEKAEEVIERHLQSHLSCGVLAVRDAGDRAGHGLRYRDERLHRAGIPVCVRVAGRAWHAPERYGRLIGRPPGNLAGLAESIRRDASGADHVKIVHSGLNSLLDFGKQTRPQFDEKDLREAVRAAKARGLRVMVHANGEDPVREAVRAGCDSIEHGFFMGRKNMDRMARRGTVWVPTVCTMAACARALPTGSREARGAEKNLDHQVRQLGEALEAGVRVALGTDAGSLAVHHGRAAADEIRLMIQAGMRVEEAISGATRTGASLLGLERQLGTLKPGMPATFVGASGGPDQIPNSLVNPALVMIEGVSARKPLSGTG